MNSNFEGWFLQNQDKSYREFTFAFNKMSTSGSLFDLEKLINISKNYLSKLKASEVFNGLDEWSKDFDPEFNDLINQYKEYTISVLNIEREQKKPRKDIGCYSDVKKEMWYMFDELFNQVEYNFDKINDRDEIRNILNLYINKYYNELDDKDTWFNKMKLLCDELGYCSDMKEYKNNPDSYKGSVADISMVIRVALTTRTTTPDLYEIMKLLKTDRIRERFNRI